MCVKTLKEKEKEREFERQICALLGQCVKRLCWSLDKEHRAAPYNKKKELSPKRNNNNNLTDSRLIASTAECRTSGGVVEPPFWCRWSIENDTDTIEAAYYRNLKLQKTKS
jgi:hypothetical protein